MGLPDLIAVFRTKRDMLHRSVSYSLTCRIQVCAKAAVKMLILVYQGQMKMRDFINIRRWRDFVDKMPLTG